MARDLGFQLAEQHLRNGYDVVLPQLLVRVDVVHQLAELARRAGAAFQEVVLCASAETCVRRLPASTEGGEHPRRALDVDDLAARIRYCVAAMARLPEAVPGAVVVSAEGSLDTVAAEVDRVLRRAHGD